LCLDASKGNGFRDKIKTAIKLRHYFQNEHFILHSLDQAARFINASLVRLGAVVRQPHITALLNRELTSAVRDCGRRPI
jgi:hypothetical protein